MSLYIITNLTLIVLTMHIKFKLPSFFSRLLILLVFLKHDMSMCYHLQFKRSKSLK
ncbi:hypothetical protein Hanom_Chr09g00799511 [Helianthus anomalus]